MSIFIRLTDKNSSIEKKNAFSEERNRYSIDQRRFIDIPGSPIAYWLNKKILDIFKNNKNVGKISEPRVGMATANNELFVRQWWETAKCEINFNSKSRSDAMSSGKRWFPFTIGGYFKKWYGNNYCVVDWKNDGERVRNFKDTKTGRIRSHNYNLDYIFKKAITWSSIGTEKTSFRYVPSGYIFSNSGYGLFTDLKKYCLLIGILNHNISKKLLNIITPSMGFEPGYIRKLPVLFPKDNKYIDIVKTLINISKIDWDLRETSWDFRCSPISTDYDTQPTETQIDENLTDVSWPSAFGKRTSIREGYESFVYFWTEQFKELHENEEELNRVFIDLYDLNDEMAPDVPYTGITILQNELDKKALGQNQLIFKPDEIMKQFISYAVGCIFGRYSLDKDGLVLANAGDDIEEYYRQIPEPSFVPDESGILPVTADEDYADDLPSQFRSFLRTSFGDQNYRENISFIEEAVGKDIRNYFLKNFYSDHVKRYKKRPIYWMISSPNGSFKALIYLHRYHKDTINRFLNDYLRPYQQKIKAKIENNAHIIDSGSYGTTEKNRAQKQITEYEKQLKELSTWEKDVVYPLASQRIELDLDDGVKVNYGKLGAILEKVKGLNA